MVSSARVFDQLFILLAIRNGVEHFNIENVPKSGEIVQKRTSTIWIKMIIQQLIYFKYLPSGFRVSLCAIVWQSKTTDMNFFYGISDEAKKLKFTQIFV